MKAQRDSLLAQAGKIVGISVSVDHDKLVTEALDAFTKAEQKMEGAIAQIDSDIAAKEKEVAKIQGSIQNAGVSKDKLSRVLDRIKAFTA